MRRLWDFLCEVFPDWIVPAIMGIIGAFIGIAIARAIGIV